MATFFYNETIASYSAAFAQLFSNIEVSIPENGTEKRLRLPLHFAPTSLFLEQRKIKPTIESNKALMANGLALSYDISEIELGSEERQRNLHQKLYSFKNGSSYTTFAPVAYNFGFVLTLKSKKLDRALQVVEQILPYFSSPVAIKLKSANNPFLDGKSLSVTLQSTSRDVDIETTYGEGEHMFIYTFMFSMTGWLFKKIEQVDDSVEGRIERIELTMTTVDYDKLVAVGFDNNLLDPIAYEEEIIP